MTTTRHNATNSYISIILLLLLFIGYGPVSDQKPILITIGALFFISAFATKYRRINNYFKIRGDDRVILICTGVLIFIFSIGQALWTRNTHSLLLIAPITILLSNNFIDGEQFKKALYYTTTLIVLLAIYEHLTSSYIYVKSLEVGGESIELSQDLFSGSSSLFRAKSIFLGPLTFSAYLICTAIILRDNRKALTICLVGALLSSSRSAIIIIILVSLTSNLKKSPSKAFTQAALTLFVSIIGAFLLIQLYPTYGNRLAETLDFSGGSATNSYRQMFWLSAISEISKYSITKIIFGDNGYFRSIYNNNAESGWLTLTLDFGIVGLLAYLTPLITKMHKANSFRDRVLLLLILIANSVFTLCYGVTGCFMYWMAILSFNNKETPQ